VGLQVKRSSLGDETLVGLEIEQSDCLNKGGLKGRKTKAGKDDREYDVALIKGEESSERIKRK